MAELLADKGIAWLMEDDLAAPRPGDRDWAADYLTARYATADAAIAWNRHLRPMPARAAVAAAQADPGADPAVRIAVLTLMPVVRGELEAALAALDEDELGLISQIRQDGAGWTEIGKALAMTKQGAEQRTNRLERRVRSTTR